MVFVELPIFSRCAQALFSDAQLRELQQVLLENGYTAVRLPAHRGKLDPPIPLQDAPGPLQAFRLADGRWTGGSRLLQPEESTERVTDISVRITATGPLFAEAMLRYAFSSGGHYEVRVGLEAEAAVILIREDVDTGLIGAPLLSAEFFSVTRGSQNGAVMMAINASMETSRRGQPDASEMVGGRLEPRVCSGLP